MRREAPRRLAAWNQMIIGNSRNFSRPRSCRHEVRQGKAGAGFGKTPLAVARAELFQLAGSSVAWLALVADDDEPARFLR